ncbi:helix-turn-helix transcriptional regulator [Allokutzneria oryzae]|uniref:Helix-turn-helix transcriptional regulator n=1 Tax=Allokutzneria oryzae TaxID=1378989 RepID=A0ABV6A0Z9_9PSEU
MNNRTELAEFLRSRRARVLPVDVGLPAGHNRRTPGLRREEVARLAAISVDYYTRMEQARGPRPSRQVLGGLARALRLSDDERRHLFTLVGETPEPVGEPPQDVPAGVLHLLDRLDDTPAFVIDAKYDMLAWNDMAVALGTDYSALPPKLRNLARQRFLMRPERPFDAEQAEQFGREMVADLRQAAARYPHSAELGALVAELLASSEEFADLWAEHEVRVLRGGSKRMWHPEVGDLVLDCQRLMVPEADQCIVLYTAAPGTPSHEALRLLKVLGAQRFSSSRSAQRDHRSEPAPAPAAPGRSGGPAPGRSRPAR